MSTELSLNAKAYYLSTGTRATWNATVTGGFHVGSAPSNLTEITLAKDVSYKHSVEKVDVSTRGDNGWKIFKAALADLELTITMPYDPANAGVLAFEKALRNRTVIALAILSGAKTAAGADGIWADFTVLRKEKNEQLADAQNVSFTVKPGDSSVPLEKVRVS
jgi:hypothetical protein